MHEYEYLNLTIAVNHNITGKTIELLNHSFVFLNS